MTTTSAVLHRALAAAIVTIGLAGCGDDGGDTADPASVIEEYRSAYNASDIDAVMALFSEASVMTGHPVGSTAEASGLDAIRAVHLTDLAIAAQTDAYTFSSIEVDGDSVTWAHRWTTNRGGSFCGAGHEATVDNGVIVSWVWPSTGPCS
ncbi:MAG: nuclear transport factor 2 family protein [Actinomycetota bacterium]